jgi:hypothetical protein
VVQPEDRVGRRSICVLHDSSDTVVAPSVRTTLGTASHIGIIPFVVATVDHLRIGVGGLGVVIVTSKTMEGVTRTGSHVDSKVGELLYLLSVTYQLIRSEPTYAIGDTVAAGVDRAQPLARKDGRGGKVSRVPSLIPPGQVAVKTTLAAQQILKSPQVIPVPEKELGATVDIGCQRLVESDQILVSTLGLAKLA